MMGSAYCTCTDHKCPLHPSNHDMGCTPCVRKNQNQQEIPSCFFRLISDERPAGYTFEHFADMVHRCRG